MATTTRKARTDGSAAVITSRAAIQRMSETFRQVLAENIQLQRKLEEASKSLTVKQRENSEQKVVVTAKEMELIKLAPIVSKRMQKTIHLVEGHVKRGGNITRADRAFLREAAAIADFDQALQRARREGVVLVVG